MADLYKQEFIGDKPASETVYHHASTLDKNMVIENAVLAGPVTFCKHNNSNRNFSYRMSKIEVNTVDVQCGSTLTLGSSGKTVQLATGASQSGFGRSGTVDWQTS